MNTKRVNFRNCLEPVNCGSAILSTFFLSRSYQSWKKKQLGITAATIKSIINSFPITRHNNYAKTCRLYIQFVEKLKSINPSLYNQLQLGNHTVRSTGSYWSGIWIDLSIEQILMKPLKRISGIIGERITENVMYIWTKAIHMYSSFQ